ncbi:hypothetical protein BY996DRAFT_6412059 [Phakopsora pachyrhizi]|nr:hypothetical protein BY996DRAFT_6412059 [Phakopsora pachyrhizi]
MPRIPTRTTPYDSPTRQHRHFKNKRDQILRSLGRSSYINGSQFAIAWISARGEAETYASPVLQNLLGPKEGEGPREGEVFLFGPEVLKKAKEVAKAQSNVESSEISLEIIKMPQLRSNSMTGSIPYISRKRKFNSSFLADERRTLEKVAADDFPNRTPPQNPEKLHPESAKRGKKSPLLSLREVGKITRQKTLNSNEEKSSLPKGKLNELLRNQNQELVCSTQETGSSDLKSSLRKVIEKRESDMKSQQQNSAHVVRRSSFVEEPPRVVRFTDPQSLYQFFSMKFGQLQQSTCKLVSKAWIKVIEPKKQTKFPYRSGNDGKPDWWPEGLRHREPDHLMKPERIELMVSVLGAGKVSVGKLELASAEIQAFIPAEKMAILDDIYKVAKEEERLRHTHESDSGWFYPFAVELGGTPSETSNTLQASASETKLSN